MRDWILELISILPLFHDYFGHLLPNADFSLSDVTVLDGELLRVMYQEI